MTWANDNCDKCGKTGYIIVKRLLTEQKSLIDYVYKCTCSHGVNKNAASIDVNSIRTKSNKLARFIVIKKVPWVLMDTQIWKGEYPTGEIMKQDEIVNLYKRENGFGLDPEKKEVEAIKIMETLDWS